MARLGVGYEVLREANPKLVYCAITGFGSDGPFVDKPGHDLNYIAYAGVLDQLATQRRHAGRAELPDRGLAGRRARGRDADSRRALASGARRRRTLPQRIDDACRARAQRDGAIALANRADATTRAGAGLLNGGVPCYNVYRTRDDRCIAVGALELKFWETLCKGLGPARMGVAALEPRPGDRRPGCGRTDAVIGRRASRNARGRMVRAARTARLLRRAGPDAR